MGLKNIYFSMSNQLDNERQAILTNEGDMRAKDALLRTILRTGSTFEKLGVTNAKGLDAIIQMTRNGSMPVSATTLSGSLAYIDQENLEELPYSEKLIQDLETSFGQGTWQLIKELIAARNEQDIEKSSKAMIALRLRGVPIGKELITELYTKIINKNSTQLPDVEEERKRRILVAKLNSFIKNGDILEDPLFVSYFLDFLELSGIESFPHNDNSIFNTGEQMSTITDKANRKLLIKDGKKLQIYKIVNNLLNSFSQNPDDIKDEKRKELFSLITKIIDLNPSNLHESRQDPGNIDLTQGEARETEHPTLANIIGTDLNTETLEGLDAHTDNIDLWVLITQQLQEDTQEKQSNNSLEIERLYNDLKHTHENLLHVLRALKKFYEITPIRYSKLIETLNQSIENITNLINKKNITKKPFGEETRFFLLEATIGISETNQNQIISDLRGLEANVMHDLNVKTNLPKKLQPIIASITDAFMNMSGLNTLETSFNQSLDETFEWLKATSPTLFSGKWDHLEPLTRYDQRIEQAKNLFKTLITLEEAESDELEDLIDDFTEKIMPKIFDLDAKTEDDFTNFIQTCNKAKSSL